MPLNKIHNLPNNHVKFSKLSPPRFRVLILVQATSYGQSSLCYLEYVSDKTVRTMWKQPTTKKSKTEMSFDCSRCTVLSEPAIFLFNMRNTSVHGSSLLLYICNCMFLSSITLNLSTAICN